MDERTALLPIMEPEAPPTAFPVRFILELLALYELRTAREQRFECCACSICNSKWEVLLWRSHVGRKSAKPEVP